MKKSSKATGLILTLRKGKIEKCVRSKLLSSKRSSSSAPEKNTSGVHTYLEGEPYAAETTRHTKPANHERMVLYWYVRIWIQPVISPELFIIYPKINMSLETARSIRYKAHPAFGALAVIVILKKKNVLAVNGVYMYVT